MARIRGKDTKPEILVRRALHAMGYRFRVHRRDLPGVPDIVLPKYKTAIFVNGCFWHRHSDCKYAYTPKTRQEFWQKKFEGNVARDELHQRQLQDLGWRVVVIWECEVSNNDELPRKLHALLNA